VITAFLADKKLFYKRIFKHRRRKNRIAPIVSKIEENGNVLHEYESSITIGAGNRYRFYGALVIHIVSDILPRHSRKKSL
jgi:hypothetical protein